MGKIVLWIYEDHNRTFTKTSFTYLMQAISSFQQAFPDYSYDESQLKLAFVSDNFFYFNRISRIRLMRFEFKTT